VLRQEPLPGGLEALGAAAQELPDIPLLAVTERLGEALSGRLVRPDTERGGDQERGQHDGGTLAGQATLRRHGLSLGYERSPIG
jgi:hypothetical protein